eukprot:5431614-Pleurochrysis_carterae.AAC.1
MSWGSEVSGESGVSMRPPSDESSPHASTGERLTSAWRPPRVSSSRGAPASAAARVRSAVPTDASSPG